MIKRLKIMEFHETSYCPPWLRDYLTDFLSFFTYHLDPYRPAWEKLQAALEKSQTEQIVDFCSGSGRYMIKLLRYLNASGKRYCATVCDKFPHQGSIRELAELSHGTVNYLPEPVDITQLEMELPGFYTIFSGIHHFSPETLQNFISNALHNGHGVAFFDYTKRDWRHIFVMTLLVPGLVWGVTPFIRPFSWQRLFFTYIIPLVPLLVMVDGCISNWKAYSVTELKAMAEEFKALDCHWQIGETRSIFGLCPVTYLIGYPAADNQAAPESKQNETVI